MGIDAEVQLRSAVTWEQKEIDTVLERLRNTFGGPNDNPHYREWGGNVCLSDPCILEICLNSRYYGPKYTIGDFGSHCSVLRFLRDAYPGLQVFYSGWPNYVDEFTPEFEAEVWAHFVKHGHTEHRKDL